MASERAPALRRGIGEAVAGSRLWMAHLALRVLPTGAASWVGGLLGRTVGRRLYPSEHRRARETMRALRPDLAIDEASLAAALERTWDNIGRAYAEISAEDRLWDEGRIEIGGSDELAKLLTDGRPIIVAGLHLGNWELLPNVLCRLGHDVICVYEPPPNRHADAIAKRMRLATARNIAASRGISPDEMFRLIPPSHHAGIELARAVRSGRTMMMYVDEDVRGKCFAPAFGRALPSEGNLLRVVRLARLTNAAVVPAYVERLAGAHFRAIFLPVVEDAGGSSERLVRALNEAIAGPVRRLLDQWLMLLTYRLRK